MVSDYVSALVAGAVLALVYVVLHFAGPSLPGPEEETRPFYYGVATFFLLLVGLGWVAATGQWAAGVGFAIILTLGGLGMLFSYQWHAAQRHAAERRVDELAGGPPPAKE